MAWFKGKNSSGSGSNCSSGGRSGGSITETYPNAKVIEEDAMKKVSAVTMMDLATESKGPRFVVGV